MPIKKVFEFSIIISVFQISSTAPSSPGHSIDDDDHIRESCPNIGEILRHKLATACSVRGLVKRFPILEWMPKYQTSFLLSDFVAGLSVGLTAIPQGELNLFFEENDKNCNNFFFSVSHV